MINKMAHYKCKLGLRDAQPFSSIGDDLICNNVNIFIIVLKLRLKTMLKFWPNRTKGCTIAGFRIVTGTELVKT